MSRLKPNHLVQSPDEQVNALLGELVEMLKALQSRGEPSYLNLAEIPLGSETRSRLRHLLGEGEIQAEAELDDQRVEVVACGVAGIWWVTHLDAAGNRRDEFIEVNFFPDILTASGEEVGDGIASLQAELFQRARHYRAH